MLRFSELFSGLEPGRRLNDAQSTIAYLILKTHSYGEGD